MVIGCRPGSYPIAEVVRHPKLEGIPSMISGHKTNLKGPALLEEASEPQLGDPTANCPLDPELPVLFGSLWPEVGPTSDMVEKGPAVPEEWVGKPRWNEILTLATLPAARRRKRKTSGRRGVLPLSGYPWFRWLEKDTYGKAPIFLVWEGGGQKNTHAL